MSMELLPDVSADADGLTLLRCVILLWLMESLS